MNLSNLVPGRIYLVKWREPFMEFSRLSVSEKFGIFHLPGEPDMQSCEGFWADDVLREATAKEAAECRRKAGLPDYELDDEGCP